MKRAILMVTMEALRSVLHLPDSVKIVHVSQDAADFSANRVLLYITGDEPSLPEVPEGNVASFVNAEFRRNEDGEQEFVRFV